MKIQHLPNHQEQVDQLGDVVAKSACLVLGTAMIKTETSSFSLFPVDVCRTPLQRELIREDRKREQWRSADFVIKEFLSALDESQTKENSDGHLK